MKKGTFDRDIQTAHIHSAWGNLQWGKRQCEFGILKSLSFCEIWSDKIFMRKDSDSSLCVAPSVNIRADKTVYAIVAKSLLPYITSVPNFWNIIYEKLFVK